MLLLGLVVSGAISYVMPKQYESTARIYVSVDAQIVSELYTGAAYVASRMKSYAELASHAELASRMISELSLPESTTQLGRKIRAESAVDTVILTFTVTDRDPARAQVIARTGSQLLVTYVEELETPPGQLQPQVNAHITDAADFQPNPVSPQIALNLSVAALIGLLLGVGLATVRELLDNTVKLADDIKELAAAPVMASVGTERRIPKEPLLTDVSGFSPRGEAFRLLRTNLQYLDIDHDLRSLVITSAVAGEGKTHTAVNLAITLAQAGQRVLIVDADLRRPRVAQLLGLDRSIGFTTVLVGRNTPAEAIQVHQESGVHVLASGPTPPNPTEILQTHAARDLLHALRDSYDTVVIDAPPLLPVSDASILGTITDGVLMVTRYGKTKREQLEVASARVRGVGGRLHGVVVNMVPKRAAEGYHYYYYYYEATRPGADTSRKTPGRFGRKGDRAKAKRSDKSRAGDRAKSSRSARKRADDGADVSK